MQPLPTPHASISAAKWLCISLLLYLCITPQQTNAANEPTHVSQPAKLQIAPPESMEEVVVTGSRAGPRLWKVSRDGHVLWILGTLNPLPAKMTWDASAVEEVLKDSQLVLTQVEVKPDVSIFGMLPLYLQARRVSRLPKGETLDQWLPDTVYQRFLTLQQRYAANDDSLLRLRPLAAAGQIYRKAVTANGLKGGGEVQDAVLKLARRHKVKVEEPTIKVDDPRDILRQADLIDRNAEVACLDATLSRIEHHMGAMQQRAALWALGDIAGFTRVDYPKQTLSCWDALLSIPRVKDVRERIVDEWFQAAQRALERNRSTIALRFIDDLLAEDGVLAKFRAAGYLVEQP